MATHDSARMHDMTVRTTWDQWSNGTTRCPRCGTPIAGLATQAKVCFTCAYEPDEPTPLSPEPIPGPALCLIESTAELVFMAGGRYCSLPRGHQDGTIPGHPTGHIAYRGHHVTGNGADVIWLGPWADGLPGPEGDERERLTTEWAHRP